jgi:peptide deformylase
VVEGCLSLPDLRGVVPRAAAVELAAVDRHGKVYRRRFEGFPAAVVQHECDHLDGILYPMRVTDFSRFGYTSVLFPELDPAADD